MFKRVGSLLVMLVFGVGLVGASFWGAAPARALPGAERVSEARLRQNAFSANGLIRYSPAVTYFIYLPFTARDGCGPATGETYGNLTVTPLTLDPENHPDINLAVRGYVQTTDYVLGLVDISGATDPGAPQVAGLFPTAHAPGIVSNDQVYGWWDGCNCRIGPISPPDDPDVTLINMAANAGDIVRVPDRTGGDIGAGYKALVLYAAPNRITLKYTSEDSMTQGYGLHIENICVDPTLLALYRQLHGAGRTSLPALTAGQAVGRAMGGSFGVAIRDNGAFLDPRSRKDWWRGY